LPLFVVMSGNSLVARHVVKMKQSEEKKQGLGG
jgi:hypothetical protein